MDNSDIEKEENKEENKEEKREPLLPFDSTVTDNFIIYSQSPFVKYERNRSYLDESTIMMNNPNMVKYYTVNEEEPIKVGGDKKK